MIKFSEYPYTLQLDMASVYEATSNIQISNGITAEGETPKFDAIVWTSSMRRLYTLVDR